jgi:hypothetical protein
MKKLLITISLFLLCILQIDMVKGQAKSTSNLEENFLHPPASARPWVFWYWMHAAVSQEGITADLEAMKQGGYRWCLSYAHPGYFVCYSIQTNCKATFK